MEPQGIVKAFRKVKRSPAVPTANSAEPVKRAKAGGEIKGSWLSGVTAYIIPAGIGKARMEIFQKQISQNGGSVWPALSPGVTHVILDDGVECERALRLLKVWPVPVGVQLVRSSWLSLCISEKRAVSTADYCLSVPSRPQPPGPEPGPSPLQNTQSQPSTSCDQQPLTHQPPETPAPGASQGHTGSTQFSEGENESDGEEGRVLDSDLEALISGQSRSDPHSHAPTSSPTLSPTLSSGWVCAQSSDSKKLNHNQQLTDKLAMLGNAYTQQGDRWRALGYSKAINALKSHPKLVTSYQEACGIPGIGKRMAEKIQEILESGHLRQLDFISQSVAVLETFSNIWGAGSKTAQMWYQQGFRTLDDIQEKASLTKQQRIGLKHYHDFRERMPRAEAAEIEQQVREAALGVNEGLLAMACGSFRRGKPTCGDVDVLVTHPDGRSHCGVFSKILSALRASGFLTDDLLWQDSGKQQKYLGVCRLPGQRHRRLDIIVVPHSELACALLYFTGSAHFNRSMRALAKTKQMSLSEHSLNRDVLRSGATKISRGLPLSTPTERDVFQCLGLPYREPHERDW
ncbi:DNA polymerase lambda [Callorhinchus milii]|uniref:DNA polymerase n=2 Tax=Callorhinchus milii TaxID=7868 RepID=A0A4W3J1W4_CALMI|nr:DNA polymerase lambda [Callorhinchus milii]XP_007909583.1 DNA polymerase lambda [Callorhinchus milii]XP_007909584.1 DNA polymerase lambda [Callorhinchus milii]|eukprot:gi/632985264/ref/XP_007909582.1/ PREDICTED: DNA polymerase lambda [Callorhinchus milii]